MRRVDELLKDKLSNITLAVARCIYVIYCSSESTAELEFI